MTSEPKASSSQIIGIVGLGLVGRALASRMKAAGYTCIGCDVRPEAMEFFVSLGFTTEASVAKLANQTNILILTVFDTTGVLQVVEKILQDRAIDTQQQHLTLIDCSTGDPLVLEKLVPQLESSGVHFLEAPLSGASVQIENGEATMLLGGEAADIEALTPVLRVLASRRVHVGDVGMASRAKLATNLVLGLNRAALAEGMVFAQSIGITPDAFLQLVLSTPARSEAAVVKGAMMVNEQFEPQSRIRQHLKDVDLMLDIARGQNQNLPLSKVHSRILRDAIAAGDGDLDNSAIIRQIRRDKLCP